MTRHSKQMLVVTPSQEVQERRFMLTQSTVQRLGRVRLIVPKIV